MPCPFRFGSLAPQPRWPVAYKGSGRMPFERASKLGHVKFIKEPRIQRLLELFERVDDPVEDIVGERTGTIDLTQPCPIEHIVAIDGSAVAVPNSIKQHKAVAFV